MAYDNDTIPFGQDSLRIPEDTVFPFDEIPDRVAIEPGQATLEITEIKSRYSRGRPEEGKSPKKMIVAEAEVIEPQSSAGLRHTMYFVLGTEEDPEGCLIETLKRQSGAVEFRQLITAARVPRVANQKESDLFLRAKGCRFVTEIREEKDRMGEEIRTRNKGYYPVGHTLTSPANGGRGATSMRLTPPTQAASAPQRETIACPTCSEPVARSNWGEHFKSHQQVAPEHDPVP